MSSSLDIRKALVPYLTNASHIPAPFISAFLLVHLSAPVVANIGGASLSSSVMLLGREYYQGSPRELLLLFGPLGLHISASILKRLLSPYPSPSPRPLRSLLSASAYTVITLLPIHVLIHRIYPTDASPPISSIGPAQLDFSFVQRALQKFPIRSVIMYSTLAGASILHALEGISLLYDVYAARSDEPKRWEKSRVQRRRIAGAVGIVGLIGGIYALWAEPIGMSLPSVLARLDAILDKSIVYRI